MYPCYGDYWLTGVSPDYEYEYDYTDDDYDVYLFWPSSSQTLVPVEDFEPVSPLEIHSDFGDELDELDLGLAHLRNFDPTWSFDSDFIFPDTGSMEEEDAYGYSKLFRMGLVSKSRIFTRGLDGLLKSAWQTFTSSVRKLGVSR